MSAVDVSEPKRSNEDDSKRRADLVTEGRVYRHLNYIPINYIPIENTLQHIIETGMKKEKSSFWKKEKELLNYTYTQENLEKILSNRAEITKNLLQKGVLKDETISSSAGDSKPSAENKALLESSEFDDMPALKDDTPPLQHANNPIIEKLMEYGFSQLAKRYDDCLFRDIHRAGTLEDPDDDIYGPSADELKETVETDQKTKDEVLNQYGNIITLELKLEKEKFLNQEEANKKIGDLVPVRALFVKRCRVDIMQGNKTIEEVNKHIENIEAHCKNIIDFNTNRPADVKLQQEVADNCLFRNVDPKMLIEWVLHHIPVANLNPISEKLKTLIKLTEKFDIRFLAILICITNDHKRLPGDVVHLITISANLPTFLILQNLNINANILLDWRFWNVYKVIGFNTLVQLLQKGIDAKQITEYAQAFQLTTLGIYYDGSKKITREIWIAALNEGISVRKLLAGLRDPNTQDLFLNKNALHLLRHDSLPFIKPFHAKAMKIDPEIDINLLLSPIFTMQHYQVMEKFNCRATEILHLHGSQLVSLVQHGVLANNEINPELPCNINIPQIDVDWWSGECSEHLSLGFSYAEIEKEFREKNLALLTHPEALTKLPLKQVPCKILMQNKNVLMPASSVQPVGNNSGVFYCYPGKLDFKNDRDSAVQNTGASLITAGQTPLTNALVQYYNATLPDNSRPYVSIDSFDLSTPETISTPSSPRLSGPSVEEMD